jgi:hypothetical protein
MSRARLLQAALPSTRHGNEEPPYGNLAPKSLLWLQRFRPKIGYLRTSSIERLDQNQEQFGMKNRHARPRGEYKAAYESCNITFTQSFVPSKNCCWYVGRRTTGRASPWLFIIKLASLKTGWDSQANAGSSLLNSPVGASISRVLERALRRVVVHLLLVAP